MTVIITTVGKTIYSRVAKTAFSTIITTVIKIVYLTFVTKIVKTIYSTVVTTVVKTVHSTVGTTTAKTIIYLTVAASVNKTVPSNGSCYICCGNSLFYSFYNFWQNCLFDIFYYYCYYNCCWQLLQLSQKLSIRRSF